MACLEAAAVIVPSAAHHQGSLVTSDVETVKALLSIAAQARQRQAPLPYVVAEIQDVRKLPVIERAYPGAVEVVAGDATISRLMVQNVLHPGLSEVYNELLTAGEGNEIYVRSGEPVAGRTLAELAAERPEAIVLGLLRPHPERWDVRLVAPSDTRIEASDRLVLMARNYQQTEPDPKAERLPEVTRPQPRPVVRPADTGTRRILVLGWNRRVPSLVAEFASYRDLSFQLDLVSVVPASERTRAIERSVQTSGTVRCRHIEADYMNEAELRALGPEGYDHILLLSSDWLPSGEEADARAMVGYLQLEDRLAEAGVHPHRIVELSDPANRSLLGSHLGEMMISPMILSHLLAQVALRRELRVVMEELFTAGGAEVQFRDPDDYPLPASADFHLLEKTVAAGGEIALGVWRHAPDENGRHLSLNPPRRAYLDLRPGDRLVVLCQT